MDAEKVEGVMILTPAEGHLDASNRDEFRAALAAYAAEATASGIKALVLDLSKVRFVDSSGLGVIMNALRRFRGSGGDMAACNIASQVQVLFDLVRLDRVMSVHADRSAAVASFADGAIEGAAPEKYE